MSIYRYLLARQLRIVKARQSFWHFCKLLHPNFYNNERPHLQEYCETLQSFVEGKISKADGTPYKNLIIEKPPRHGKTRTLILLSTWLLGRDNTFKIISTSYNDNEASSFSKYTRDTIKEEKNIPIQIVFSDIFPDTKIKYGDASTHEWALEGQFFNYKGSGIGGTITGKGGNLIIVDDPVKNAEEAFNENHLTKLWQWFTGTLLSRQEHGALKIICHTPWCKKDIGGRLQDEQAGDWFVYSRPAQKDGVMLCPQILDKDEYEILKKTMEPLIFSANYEMIRLDVKGLLYGKDWKTYTDFPVNEKGEPIYRIRKAWCDTADAGDDFYCHIIGDVANGFIYVVDVYYTKDDVTKTGEETAARIVKHKPTYDLFEANSGGHAISILVKNILHGKYKHFTTNINTQDQRKNKEARILANAFNVKEKIIFPVDWMYRWPEFYRDVTNFMKEGKNKHDDAPDTLTMIVEHINHGQVGLAWVG